MQSHCGQFRECQRKYTLPLRVMKFSVQWPEIHGHAEARGYISRGNEYADECQLHSRAGLAGTLRDLK